MTVTANVAVKPTNPITNELDSGELLFSALTMLSEFGTPVKLLLMNISLVLGVLYKAVLYILLPELDDKLG